MRLPKDIPIFGDVDFRDTLKLRKKDEDCEQIDSVAWLKENHPDDHALFVHPKNEGRKNHKQITKDIKMGSFTIGASDAIIPCILPFVCEIKQKDHTHSSISAKQLKYLRTAKRNGAFACIALGFDGFKLAHREWKQQQARLLQWLKTTNQE